MKPKLEIFAVGHSDGTTRGVMAVNFRVTRDGRLIFYSWPWKQEAAFDNGTWNGGVARGVEVKTGGDKVTDTFTR